MTDIITINAKGIVPNHLNDTNIFCRYSKNNIIDVEPKEIHFGGYKINEKNYQDIKFTNISDEICRFHIIPPISKYFRLQYTKLERMVPGFFIMCTVIFTPDKVRNYNDFIKIHTKDSENNIAVPIYAYPAITGLSVPRNIKFPITAIGKSSKRQICLHSDSETDFEFEIVTTTDHSSIKVEPLKGFIPGRGDKIIFMEFSPTAYVTCEKTIQIYVNQYNFKPIVCSLFGTAQPGLERNEILEIAKKEKGEKSNLMSIVKLESKRRVIHPQNSIITSSVKVFDKVSDVDQSKQQLKAEFESRLSQNVNNERQNQMRWQTCRGDFPLNDEEVDIIKEQREIAKKDYEFRVRNQKTMFHLYKNDTNIKNNWNKTISYDSNISNNIESITTPQFLPECWIVRKFALDRFRSAAWQIIINSRLRRRFKILFNSGGEYHDADNFYISPGGENLQFVRELNGISEERILKKQSFPKNHFNMSEYKLTLPIQPNYKFESLIVPLQMQVLGYERIDITSLSYIPQKSTYSPKSSTVIDATGTTSEESNIAPIKFRGKTISTNGAYDDTDYTLIPFLQSCSYYDKHSYFPLYYYENELMESKNPIEMEWQTPKSSFLVSKKNCKYNGNQKIIVNALSSNLLSTKVPDLLTKESLQDFDYKNDNSTGPSINRLMMLEEFTFLDTCNT